MSSAIPSPQFRTAAPAPGGVDLERLRYPGERIVFGLGVLSNFAVVALAVFLVLKGTAWVATHPAFARSAGTIRTVVLAAIFAGPVTTLTRRITFAAALRGGVRVGEHQFSELYAQFLAACRKLGVDPVPELYLSREVEGIAAAHALPGGRSVVILNAEFVDEDWIEGLDWLTFAAAGALGAIRLGHTLWWVELLTVYSRQVPGLRAPILVRWTLSRDRCAAFCVPDGVRGIIVEAVGNHALPAVDVPAFVEQTERPAGFWDRMANIARKRPSIVTRARALYEAGFFDRARDRQRHPFLPPGPRGIVA